MDVDLESVEIVFAQKLTCGEPPVRAKALEELQRWIQKQSTLKPFQDCDLIRLCKGLHYTMWMQDKMILQEELADKIAGLIQYFATEDEKARYLGAALKSLSHEWSAIDKWRMDKFLMLIRRIVRAAFHHLALLNWEGKVSQVYWNVLGATVISADAKFQEPLKFHFASLFLDELDLAGNIQQERITALLEPFAALLTVKSISNYLFDSIIQEIYITILHAVAEELAAKESHEPEQKKGITFDYAALAAQLFAAGKQEQLTTSRRQRLYAVSQKKDVVMAVDKLNELQRKVSSDREKARKSRKPRKDEKTDVNVLHRVQKKITQEPERIKESKNQQHRRGRAM